MITIYHNPRCGKSRCALDVLNSRADLEIREYLKNAPTPEELRDLMKKLDMRPLEFIRTGEEVFKQKYKGKNLSDDQWLEAIAENPVLLQRPIVVKGKKAWIVRDESSIETIKNI